MTNHDPYITFCALIGYFATTATFKFLSPYYTGKGGVMIRIRIHEAATEVGVSRSLLIEALRATSNTIQPKVRPPATFSSKVTLRHLRLALNFLDEVDRNARRHPDQGWTRGGP